MGYTFRLAAWDPLYASSHRQNNTVNSYKGYGDEVVLTVRYMVTISNSVNPS